MADNMADNTEGFETREVKGWTEVTTASLDPDNEKIKIYRKLGHGKYVIHDNGYVFKHIERSGAEVDKDQIDRILIRHGVLKTKGAALQVRASEKDLEEKQGKLIKAITDIFKHAYEG